MRIFFTTLLGLSMLAVNAQQQISNTLKEVGTVVTSNLVAKTAASNTLVPASMTSGCGTSVAFYSVAQYSATSSYTNDTRGYAFGTNVTYYTTGGTTYTICNTTAAQKYSVNVPSSVTGVIVLAAKARSDAGTTLVNAKVFSENTTTKKPNTQLGANATKALNSFVTGSNYNVINFTTPVNVPTGNFFVGIESPSIGGATHDTLAILSTTLGCSSSTDTLSWSYRTQVSPAGTATPKWYSVKMLFGNNLDLAIFAIVDDATGLEEFSHGNLTLSKAFPNPASNQVAINFELKEQTPVEIQIIDLTGKIVKTLKLENEIAGKHSVDMNVADLSSGIYMYAIQTSNGKLASKFTIQK